MKFINNIFITIATAFIAVIVLGCSEEFLSESPRSEIASGDYFINEAQAIAITNAAYSGLAAKPGNYRFGYARDLGYIVDAPTDIQRVITSRGPMDNMTVSEGFNWNNGIWRTLYMAISQANLAISRLPEMPIDDALKNRLAGECKFLRALSYYHIVQIWGAAPLKLTEEDALEFSQARSSEISIIAQIQQDLMDASQVLPPSYSGDDKGRVTSGAAKSLLGKTYLLNQQYSDAEEIFEDVMKNHDYKLLDDYGQVFSIYNENNEEIIFDIQFNAAITGQNFSDFHGSRHITTEGARQSSLGGGFGVVRQHPEFAELFKGEDIRRRLTIVDTVPVTGKPIPVDLWGGGKYVDSVDYAAVVNEGNNFPVIRFSDVLLCYAEALWRNNKLDEAISYVNMVRERARNSTGVALPADYPTGLSTEEVKVAIRLERKLELAGEGHGWYDAKRFGTLVEDNAYVGVTATDPDYKWPIPSTERDANPLIDEIVD